METGQVDPEVVNSIACAREAGVEYVDTYLFPCKNEIILILNFI